MSIFSKLRPLSSHLTQEDAHLFLQACACLLLARASVKLLPFKATTKLFRLQTLDLPVSTDLSSPRLPSPIALAVKRAAKYLPGKYVCLPQALAGLLLLGARRQHARLILGVRKDNTDTLSAHAWLVSNESILLGGNFHGYKTIAAFEQGSPRP